MPRTLNPFAPVIAALFLAGALAGCAASQGPSPQTTTYRPKIAAGITTISDAKKDLKQILENRDFNFMFEVSATYCQRHHIANLTRSAGGRHEITIGTVATRQYKYYWNDTNTDHPSISIDTNSLSINNNTMSESNLIYIEYGDLRKTNIHIEKNSGGDIFVIARYKNNSDDFLFSIDFLEKSQARRVADDLYFIQQHMRIENTQRNARFEAALTKYRATGIRPPITEEQRKYFVQADALARSRDVFGAIARYQKGLDIDPISYPGAYSNLALLSAQIHHFSAAIGYMKQYLALSPTAKDARSAKDDIYEWEIHVNK